MVQNKYKGVKSYASGAWQQPPEDRKARGNIGNTRLLRDEH